MSTGRATLLVAAVALSACNAKPEQTAASSNSEIEVQRLFSYEGCATYRFRDVDFHYYTRCNSGEVTTTSQHTESCGENCRRTVQESIQTVEVQQ